jgi:hypothetical protein
MLKFGKKSLIKSIVNSRGFSKKDRRYIKKYRKGLVYWNRPRC